MPERLPKNEKEIGPAPEAVDDRSEASRESYLLDRLAVEFQRSLGNPQNLPEGLTAQEYLAYASQWEREGVVTGFHELNHLRMLTSRRKALQEAARLKPDDPKDPDKPLQLLLRQQFDPDEYKLANHMLTYKQALSEITQHLSATLQNHKHLTDLISGLPSEQRKQLADKQREVRLIAQHLKTAIDTRVALGNVYAMDLQLVHVERDLDRQHTYLRTYKETLTAPQENQAQKAIEILLQRRQMLLSKRPAFVARLEEIGDAEALKLLKPKNDLAAKLMKGDLSLAEVQQGFQEGDRTLREYTNSVEKRVIDIARGEGKIEGVTEGYIIPQLFIDILKARYDQIVEQQKKMTRDRVHLKEGGPDAIEILNRERESVMRELVSYTHEMMGYQLRMSELGTFQHMFAELNTDEALDKTDTAGQARKSEKKDKDELREKTGRMKDYHLGRIEATVDKAQENFRVDLFVQFHEQMRKGVFKATDFGIWLSQALFGKGGAVGGLGEKLIGPLADSLAWPRDETGAYIPWNKLEPVQQTAIEKKFASLKEVMEEFQRDNNGNEVKSTVEALRSLDAEEGVGRRSIGSAHQEIVEAESGTVAAADVQAKLDEYQKRINPENPEAAREDAVATLLIVLTRQLGWQWGSVDFAQSEKDPQGYKLKSGTGFIGGYARMLGKIEGIIGQQLDVAGHVYQVSENFLELAKYMGMATGVAILVPVVVAVGGVSVASAGAKYTYRAGKAAYNLARRRPLTPRTGPRATGFQRMAWGGAAGVTAYDLYCQYEELGNEHKRVNDVKAKLRSDLVLAGFEAVKGEENVYLHPSGLKLRLSEMEDQLDAQRWSQYGRVGARSAELGTLLWMGSRKVISRVGGPVTIAIFATVEVGINSWESKEARDFVAKCPPWLWVVLGEKRSQAVKRSEFSMLENVSNWNVISSTEKDKQQARSNLLFGIFNDEVAAVDPQMHREITGGLHNAERIEELFTEDFQKVILPYAHARLHRNVRESGRSISWKEIAEGRVEKNSFFALNPDITLLELRSALREAAVVYRQAHLPESHYISLLTEQKKIEEALQAPDANRPELEHRMADVSYALRIAGHETVFGGRLIDTLTPEIVKKNGGRTRAELMIRELSTRASSGSIDFRIKADGEIAGLPADIDLASASVVYDRFLANPGKRGAFEQIGPNTTEEPEGAVDPDWYHTYLALLLGSNPTGAAIKELPRKQRAHAVSVLLATVGDKERVPDQISGFAAELELTRQAVRLVAQKRSGKESYKPADPDSVPLRFGSASNVSIGPIAAKPEFGDYNALAVFNEQASLKDGGRVDVSTYVYGNPADPESLYVVQKAMASVDIAQPNAAFYGISTSDVRREASETNMPIMGQPVVMSGAEFAKRQPAGRAMLDAAVEAVKGQRKRADDSIREQYKQLRGKNREEVILVMKEAQGNPGKWFSLPQGEKYQQVTFHPAHGHIYLNVRAPAREPTISAAPDPDEVRRTAGQSPVEIRTDKGVYFLRGDFREFFQKNGIDPAPCEYALSIPGDYGTIRDVQRVLFIYVGDPVQKDVITMENNLYERYKLMKTSEERQLFLRVLNENLHKRTRNEKAGTWKHFTADQLPELLLQDLAPVMSAVSAKRRDELKRTK